MDSLATVAAVSVTLIRFVLPIPQLDPDSGSQCTHRFALQKAAVVRVSAANVKIKLIFFLGPQGPLRVPLLVRSSARKKNLNHR